jgi:hypothetical protein
MATQAVNAAGNSGAVVERLLRRVSAEQLKQLVDVAEANSGRAVANIVFEPGDDICPTFLFPHPLPPRIDQFLNAAATIGTVRIFPFGIINPEGFIAQVGIGQVAG